MAAASSSSSHYDAIGSSYEQAWFYAPDSPYNEWMVNELLRALNVGGSCDASSSSAQGNRPLSICDVGGGTGHIAAALSSASSGGGVGDAAAIANFCVVEPSASMAAQAEARGLHTVVSDAVDWASEGGGPKYDRILFKEVSCLIVLDGCDVR